MAAQNNADKVFVALPETYEDGLSVLSSALRRFPRDKTEIIITHVMTSTFKGSFVPSSWLIEREKMDLVLNKYLSYCANDNFRAEKLVHMADDISEGIIQVIALNGTKNLFLRSAARSDRKDLANHVREANLSCKLWFVSDGDSVFTREVKSDGLSTEASSSTSRRSNNETTTEETKLAKKLQRKEQEIKELKEILQKEKEEKDRLRKKIEELEHETLLSREIEQVKIENDQLRSQRDEYFSQIHVANERRLAFEKQVSHFELVVKNLEVVSALAGADLKTLQTGYCNVQQERDQLAREAEELRKQREDVHSSSSTAVNSEFSLQELKQATQDFSESLKIGEGGFGSVYRGSLRQTPVAIKLLDPESLQGETQFQQEVTVLTKVRHPNIVTLMGACSEVSALVYEHLSNGSLEDRLTCANGTPPLTWQARTRIIGEICLALIFLHSNKPELVIHGDLKPENILLDANLVSKLGDFGISRLLKQPDTNTTAFLQTNSPKGTFAYTDPKYFSTGILTSKSDIYSFGIIILRLLTRKPALNIIKEVQDAERDGILSSVIDVLAGKWPFEQAEELANIGLRCAKSSRRRRPNLTEVWAVVEPLMKAACAYVEPSGPGSELDEECTPAHFICPILQDVMKDPYTAADGFTYEGDAIKEWLGSGHNTSPMTNLTLPNNNLIPNRGLRSAIQEWLEQHP